MTTLHTALRALTAAALAAVAGAAAGQESAINYFGSFQHASGEYTLSETTRSSLLFNGLSYRKGRWSFSASIPLIYQDSPFVSYAGGSPVPAGRRQGMETQDGTDGGTGGIHGEGSGKGGTVDVPSPDTLDFDKSGVGDPLFRADFAVSESRAEGPGFGVYAVAKPPLADEDSGFGTGEWDYGAGITISRQAGSILFLADLGYWVYGDLPDLELKDPLTFSLGLSHSLSGGRLLVGASVWGSTETVDGVDGPLQIGITASRLVGSGRSYSLTLSAGLTESAPDHSLSVGWRVGL